MKVEFPLWLVTNPDRGEGLSGYEPHFSHYGFKQSLEMSEKIKAKRTFFIHMTHDIEYDAVSTDLPDNVYLAYDGLQLNLN